jgi:hypothetical protein
MHDFIDILLAPPKPLHQCHFDISSQDQPLGQVVNCRPIKYTSTDADFNWAPIIYLMHHLHILLLVKLMIADLSKRHDQLITSLRLILAALPRIQTLRRFNRLTWSNHIDTKFHFFVLFTSRTLIINLVNGGKSFIFNSSEFHSWRGNTTILKFKYR